MNKRSSFNPHELAHHVAALFRNPNVNDMKPVEISMEKGIEVLQAARPTSLDLTDPDKGIPFALEIKSGSYPEKVQSAGCLLRLCLHAIERGDTTEFERQNIPLHLAALSGYVPDHNAAIARRKRLKRSERTLGHEIMRLLKLKPLINWRECADRLMGGEEVVDKWDEQTLRYDNGKKLRTISISTFRNKISETRKKMKE